MKLLPLTFVAAFAISCVSSRVVTLHATATLTPTDPLQEMAPSPTPSAIRVTTARPPEPSPTASPALMATRTFTDARMGVEFQYPEACPLGIDTPTAPVLFQVSVGPRVSLQVREWKGTLVEFVDGYIAERADTIRVEERGVARAGNVEGIGYSYRFGTGRLGLARFFAREDRVYSWHWVTDGSLEPCNQLSVLGDALRTFRLTDFTR